jgi:hypothetical protein
MSTLIKPTGEAALIIERGAYVTEKFTRVSNLREWHFPNEPKPVSKSAWAFWLGASVMVALYAMTLES